MDRTALTKMESIMSKLKKLSKSIYENTENDTQEKRLFTKTTMTMSHFHDFYFLLALQADIASRISKNPENEFKHSVNKLRSDVAHASEEIFANMALRTFVYLYTVCLGEARHAKENLAESVFFPQSIGKGRTDIYMDALNYHPDKNIEALVAVFSQDWKASFGGKAWKNIAESLQMFSHISDAAFIDHVIDLEHNGGCVFNKDEVRHPILFDVRYPAHFKHFLDYKFSNNILIQRPRFFSEPMAVSPRVYRLLKRHENIFGTPEVYWASPELANLDEYVVHWGNKQLTLEPKWFPWVDTQKNNVPSAQKAFDIMEIDGVYIPNMTVTELKKHAKECVKKLKANIRVRMTKTLSEEINVMVKKWLESAFEHAKVKKNKITYSILPCKLRSVVSGIDIAIPVEYNKLGAVTPYGFVFRVTKTIIPKYKIIESTPGYDGEKMWQDGHICKEWGKIYVFINGTKWTLKEKRLEALLD